MTKVRNVHKPQLVIMAAGLGSRYGGLKQIDPVDEQKHLLIDYAMYDGLHAGFEEVVIILKPEMEKDFKEAIGDRIAPFMDIRYAYQRLDSLPEGFPVPEGRTMPWGTAHAIMCAGDTIDGPFAAINADDFYGRGAIESIYGFLSSPHPQNEHAMVGYRIENTLTEHGHVARGVCSVGADGYLTGIVERTRIEKRDGDAVYTEDGKHFFIIPRGTTVSMNLWGFQRSMLDAIRVRFPSYLKEHLPSDPDKSEYFLPYVPGRLIAEGKARVKALPTEETWFGVTYQQDMPLVRKAIAERKARGIYPERLWRK